MQAHQWLIELRVQILELLKFGANESEELRFGKRGHLQEGLDPLVGIAIHSVNNIFFSSVFIVMGAIFWYEDVMSESNLIIRINGERLQPQRQRSSKIPVRFHLQALPQQATLYCPIDPATRPEVVFIRLVRRHLPDLPGMQFLAAEDQIAT